MAGYAVTILSTFACMGHKNAHNTSRTGLAKEKKEKILFNSVPAG